MCLMEVMMWLSTYLPVRVKSDTDDVRAERNMEKVADDRCQLTAAVVSVFVFHIHRGPVERRGASVSVVVSPCLTLYLIPAQYIYIYKYTI